MAAEICNILDRAAGEIARKCDSGCKNYCFDHRDNACVLSEVFSVKKGKPCYIYEDNTKGEMKE